jgi:hypothetical protein
VPDTPTVFITTIPYECPCCMRHLRVEAKHAGRLFRCPVCRGMGMVPGEDATAPLLSDDDPTTPLGPKPKTVRG